MEVLLIGAVGAYFGQKLFTSDTVLDAAGPEAPKDADYVKCRDEFARENTVAGRYDNHDQLTSFTRDPTHSLDNVPYPDTDPLEWGVMPTSVQRSVHPQPMSGMSLRPPKDAVAKLQPMAYEPRHWSAQQRAVTRGLFRQQNIESKYADPSGGMDGFRPGDFSTVASYQGAQGYAAGEFQTVHRDPVHVQERIFYPGDMTKGMVQTTLRPQEDDQLNGFGYASMGMVRHKGRTNPKHAVDDYRRDPVPTVGIGMAARVETIYPSTMKTSRRTDYA